MEAIPLWLQNITFSLLGGWITVTHHKNQVAPGSKVSGAHTFKTLHSSRAYRLQSLPWDSSFFFCFFFLLVKMTHCFFDDLVSFRRKRRIDVTQPQSHVEHSGFER